MKDISEALGILPPQNVEAEKSVLGSIFLDNQSLLRIVDLITPEDFYRKNHAYIYQAFLRLFERGDPIDIVTVEAELQSMGVLDQVGGIEYLMELAEFVPTPVHIVKYAQIVKEKSILRDLIGACHEIIRKCHEADKDVEELLDEAESRIFAISEKRTKSDFSPSRELVKAAISQLEKLAHKRQLITGIPTGFYDFDRMTAGLQPSDLIIVAARPSMGKTAFALNIALNVALEEGGTVAFFSLEMSKEQIAMRMLSSASRVGYQRLRTGNIGSGEWKRIIDAAAELSEAPIYIDDTPAMSVLEMRAKARRLQAEHGLDLIVVDYLQLMRGRGRKENRQQEISEISRSLKGLAKELNVPVIAVSQLSRAVEARNDKRPQLSDLRESGAIEQDADLVVFIYRDEVYNKATPEPNVAEIIIGKQRNGPTGTVKLTFIKEYTRFENYQEDMAGLDDTADELPF
ncbi:replicative DNA helicase [Thermosulfidibacter takaii ABI70S6]|uniref:Replicative DNA helicase n=1 Tax=Thermosulfidibacter takaii (strain DSM 17441 / JCM 13301 / NBRC 103674 / ABI70S6) TaxID=1298851 RepID=A0A0S3QVZ8_THET7|nr:replicative DNA helicase [Thermosulfidibacter takaii]BAT72512.1 replicative DNA helicase [Thermosulfidibacter takaii ABI70S6]